MLFVTTFNQKLYEATGKRLLDSFGEFNVDGEIFIGGENLTSPIEETYDFAAVSDILSYKWFQDWCKNNADIIPVEYGGTAVYSYTNGNKFDKYRRQAARWFRKVATLQQCITSVNPKGYVILLDCDCYFTKRLTTTQVKLIMKGKSIAHHTGTYRRNNGMGVEAGVVCFDMSKPSANRFLQDVFECFESGAFRNYDRWDDSFIFSHFLQKNRYNDIDLVSKRHIVRSGGHVICDGPFGKFIEHEKGSHIVKYNVVPHHPKSILITGANGLVGTHLVEYLLKNTSHNLCLIVKENTSNLNEIGAINNSRVKILVKDLSHKFTSAERVSIGKIDCVINLAAFTNVNESIRRPLDAIRSNVLGITHLLEYCRRNQEQAKLIHVSTAEVFGPAYDGYDYKEWDRYNSPNPYAASKAAAEEICLAYSTTYNMNISIVHTMNIFGERQRIEKFVPDTVKKILLGEPVLVHSDKTKTVSGSRHYTYAGRLAEALTFLMSNGVKHEKYNVLEEREITNLELVNLIAACLDLPFKCKMVDFHSSRPGHDLRYSMVDTKLSAMGFQYSSSFEQDLQKTVEYYRKIFQK
jgi:dTDP-glucose 4,6-dehydratase